MTHPVDAIAEKFRQLLIDQTDAQDRVTRDSAIPFNARDELPAIDIRIGEEEPEDAQSAETYIGRLTVEVELFVADAEENVSSAVLALRQQMHTAIMGGDFSGLVMAIRPAGATEITRNTDGSIPTGAQTAHFQMLFQHALTDPASF